MSSDISIVRLSELAQERLEAFNLFSPTDYFAMHPDVAAAGMDAHRHAIQHGISEGRSLFSSSSVAKKLAAVQLIQGTDQPKLASGFAYSDVNVLVSTRGNIFMNEIANLLVDDFRSLGVRARVLHETVPIESLDPMHCVVVAPHEFFSLGKGRDWLTEEFVTQCVVYNVEQPQTPWFAAGLVPMLLARGIIDLCPQMAPVWRAMGKPSIHYEPCIGLDPGGKLLERDRDHPLIAALPKGVLEYRHGPVVERPIDLCFFGTRSARRDSLFARYGARFSPYATFIYFRQRVSGPMRSNSSEGALTRVADHVASLSKICLNIHRDDAPYFEWHRMVKHGMAAGSVVISDTCLPHPWFKEKKNFLQEEARHLPNVVDWVLNTPDGKAVAESIVSNNLGLLRDSERRRTQVMGLLRFLHESKENVDARV